MPFKSTTGWTYTRLGAPDHTNRTTRLPIAPAALSYLWEHRPIRAAKAKPGGVSYNGQLSGIAIDSPTSPQFFSTPGTVRSGVSRLTL